LGLAPADHQVSAQKADILRRAFSPLFDHLVRQREQIGWNFKTKRFRSFEVDNELEFDSLLDGQLRRLLSIENFTGVDAQLAVRIYEAGPVAHQAGRANRKASEWHDALIMQPVDRGGSQTMHRQKPKAHPHCLHSEPKQLRRSCEPMLVSRDIGRGARISWVDEQARF